MSSFSKFTTLLIGLSLFISSCSLFNGGYEPEEPEHTICQQEVYLEYENLLSGETGEVTAYNNYASSMFSHGGTSISNTGAEVFRQQFYFTYRADSNYYPRVFLAFYPNMSINRVVAIPGQYYGQLYTYEDPEDFITENFPVGDILNTDTDFFIAYEEGHDPAGRIHREDLVEQSDAYVRITESSICEDDSGQAILYVKGEFAATLKVINTNSPLFGQDIFRLTNAQFAFTHPVNQAQ